jgi:sarcosine oxidase subunit alpha
VHKNLRVSETLAYRRHLLIARVNLVAVKGDTKGRDIDHRLSFTFTFNGRPVEAYEGDSVASALVRAGIFVFSRSLKFHRPRGVHCGAGRCYSCAMRVNGVPGVRTCSTRAERGMVVETEGGFPTMDTDLLSLTDHMFRRQFDYHSRFIRPRFMTPFYQKIVRRMTSPRRLPDDPKEFSPFESIDADILIVGHGVSGAAATDRLRSLGLSPVVTDRHGTDVFPPAFAFGLYEDGRMGLLSETGGMLVKARAVLLATGRVETGLDVPNADLPGVMLPEAIEHFVSRGVRPGEEAVVIGDGELRAETIELLEHSGCRVVGEIRDYRKVLRIVGGGRVRGVESAGSDGRKRKRRCDLVVLLGPLVPYVPLAQQAGVDLRAVGDFWCIGVDGSGNTSVVGVFGSGGAAGFVGERERAASGVRAADRIARFLEAR